MCFLFPPPKILSRAWEERVGASSCKENGGRVEEKNEAFFLLLSRKVEMQEADFVLRAKENGGHQEYVGMKNKNENV